MKINLKVLSNGAFLPLPAHATADSAGVDLMAAIESDIILAPGRRVLIPTGFAMALPKGYEAQIRSRSGLAIKYGVHVLNSPGTVDADYRGEIFVPLMNSGEDPFVIAPGMRIAQMIIARFEQVSFEAVESLDDTARGNQGFGSTGI